MKLKQNPQGEIMRAENLTKVFRLGDAEIRAVDGISISIKSGEFVSVLGPSGCGKSTLLHMLGLLDRPTSGDIYIEGAHVSQMKNGDVTAFRRKRLGFVFQQFNLINNLTVFENAALPLMLDEVEEHRRMEKVLPLLERLGIAHRMNNYTNNISGGEMQRVAIARALALDPDIIFADEPTGNLDSRSGEEVMRIFRELNAAGKTILMITHDRNIAKNADRIIYLRDGKIDKMDDKKG
ncbi:MAG: ABC transporter ATP-binding protein [Candidatus Micrarchaeia archaeon]